MCTDDPCADRQEICPDEASSTTPYTIPSSYLHPAAFCHLRPLLLHQSPSILENPLSPSYHPCLIYKVFQWSHFKLDFLFQSCLADVLTYLKRYSDTRCVFAFSGWIKNGQALFPLKSTFLRKKPGQSGQGPHCVCCTISACTGDHIILCTVLYQPEKHYITSYELYTHRMEKLPHFPGFFMGESLRDRLL